RGAGMDVIYAGVHRTAGEVVTAAVHEDVDILGVTLLAGAPSTVFAEVLQRLAERQREDTVVVAGGVIPDQDIARLKQLGVREFLGQDAPSQATIDALRRWVDERGPR
ncbi:MAG: cobalamin-dependent protein, partial [Phycisphaerales bacterium]